MNDVLGRVGAAEITRREFDHWYAISRRASDAPEDDLRVWVMIFLIELRWMEADLAERGLTVSEVAVTERFERQKHEGGYDDTRFEAFLASSGQSVDDLRTRVRHQLMGECLQSEGATDIDLRERWRPHTTCAEGYASSWHCSA